MTLTMVMPSVGATRDEECVLTGMVRPEGKRTVMVLRGEADLATRCVLANILSQVIADVDFIDSASFQSLVVAQEFLDRQGRCLTVRSPSRLVTRVLGLMGVSELIESPDTGEQ